MDLTCHEEGLRFHAVDSGELMDSLNRRVIMKAVMKWVLRQFYGKTEDFRGMERHSK